MRKGSILYSVLRSKCPQCHEGTMFKHPAYSLGKMRDMYDKCDKCGQLYKPEPLFYEGSMYVSYGFSVIIVAIVLITFVNLVDNPDVTLMMSIAISISVIFAPLNIRVSRMIWANIFMRYKGIEAIKKYQAKKNKINP